MERWAAPVTSIAWSTVGLSFIRRNANPTLNASAPASATPANLRRLSSEGSAGSTAGYVRTEPATSRVEWSTDLPLYDGDSGEAPEMTTEHQVDITVGFAGRGVYRVSGHAAGEELIRSGDFWFGLDSF